MIDREDEIEKEELQKAMGPRPPEFWYPALGLAFVSFAAVAFVSLARGAFGWGLVFGLPLAFGIVYGYGVKTLRPLFTFGIGLTFFGAIITVAVMGDAMGWVCALVAAGAMAGPLVVRASHGVGRSSCGFAPAGTSGTCTSSSR